MCAAVPQTSLKPKRPSQLFCLSSSCCFSCTSFLFSSFNPFKKTFSFYMPPFKNKWERRSWDRFFLFVCFYCIFESFQHLQLPPKPHPHPHHGSTTTVHQLSLHLSISLKICLSSVYPPPPTTNLPWWLSHSDLGRGCRVHLMARVMQ